MGYSYNFTIRFELQNVIIVQNNIAPCTCLFEKLLCICWQAAHPFDLKFGRWTYFGTCQAWLMVIPQFPGQWIIEQLPCFCTQTFADRPLIGLTYSLVVELIMGLLYYKTDALFYVQCDISFLPSVAIGAERYCGQSLRPSICLSIHLSVCLSARLSVLNDVTALTL